MIQEAYCSFEVSKLLKEKGFNWPCRAYTTLNKDGNSYLTKVNDICDENLTENQYLCPTHQMAVAWLRDKGIYITAYMLYNYKYGGDINMFGKSRLGKNSLTEVQAFHSYETYEKVIEVALKYALTNLI